MGSGMLGLPQLAELLEPLVHSGQCGVQWASQRCSNLTKFLSFKHPGNYDCPLWSGQQVEQFPNAATIIGPVGSIVSRGIANESQENRVIGMRGQPLCFAFEQHGLTVSHCEQPPSKGIGGNRIGVSDCLNERFLQRIFRGMIDSRSEPRNRKRKNPAPHSGRRAAPNAGCIPLTNIAREEDLASALLRRLPRTPSESGDADTVCRILLRGFSDRLTPSIVLIFHSLWNACSSFLGFSSSSSSSSSSSRFARPFFNRHLLLLPGPLILVIFVIGCIIVIVVIVVIIIVVVLVLILIILGIEAAVTFFESSLYLGILEHDDAKDSNEDRQDTHHRCNH